MQDKFSLRMRLVEKFVKCFAFLVCLVFFYILTMDVIVKFKNKLTTTGTQFEDTIEVRKHNLILLNDHMLLKNIFSSFMLCTI
jgi:hypothetical protein